MAKPLRNLVWTQANRAKIDWIRREMTWRGKNRSLSDDVLREGGVEWNGHSGHRLRTSAKRHNGKPLIEPMKDAVSNADKDSLWKKLASDSTYRSAWFVAGARGRRVFKQQLRRMGQSQGTACRGLGQMTNSFRTTWTNFAWRRILRVMSARIRHPSRVSLVLTLPNARLVIEVKHRAQQ
jgi:hypothetical protein